MTNKNERLTTVPPPALYSEDERATGITVKLTQPITHGKSEIPDVILRPLSGKDVRNLPKDMNSLDGLLTIAGNLSGLPDSVLDELVGEDVGRVTGAAQRSLWSALDMPNLRLTEEGEAESCPLPMLVTPYVLKLAEKVTDPDTKTTLDAITFQAVSGGIARGFRGSTLKVTHLPALISRISNASEGHVDRLVGMDLRNALAVATCLFGSTLPRAPVSTAP